MLVESIVFDDAVVSRTVSKLRALALFSSRSELDLSIPAKLFSSPDSKSSPPSSDLSSSPPSSFCHSDSSYNSETLVRSIIGDLIETVCRDDWTPCLPQVTNCLCSLTDFPSLDFDYNDVRLQEDWRHGPPFSPTLGDSPFQASSLLDIFYGPETFDDSTIFQDGECHHHATNHKKDEANRSSEDPDCEVIEIGDESSGCHTSFGWNWAEHLDIGFDPLALTTESSASEITFEASVSGNDSEEYIHFLKPKAWTPADLLPLYEPDVPFELSISRRESSEAVITVKDVSDLERLHYDNATDISNVFVTQKFTDLVSADDAFNNMQDLANALSDEECKSITCCETHIDPQPEYSPNLLVDDEELLWNDYPSDRCRLPSMEPIRGRIRRHSSDFSISNKRSRVSSFKDSSSENVLPSCSEVNSKSCLRQIEFRKSVYEQPFFNLRSENDSFEGQTYSELSIVSCALTFCKLFWFKAMNMLLLLWSFCTRFFISLFVISCSIFIQPFIMRISSFANRITTFAKILQKRLV